MGNWLRRKWRYRGWVTGLPHIADPTKSQQYTGLKDRNGKEIYIGDIIFNKADYYGEPFMVTNCDKINIELVRGDRDAVKSGTFTKQYVEGADVIGNIYETPELLQACLFSKGMVFYTQTFIDKFTGKSHRITVEEVKPKSNELVVSWGRDNTETWDLDLCEKGIMNGDYYFEKP